MPLALTARIKVDPKSILHNPWAHDMAHHLLRHLKIAEYEMGLPSQLRLS